MVFSNNSTGAGLVEDIDFLCASNSVSYPLIDKARNVNRHLYKAIVGVMKASGRFQWDDSNQTDLPVFTFDLVNGQRDYSLPATMLKLDGIEVKDSAGNWTRLQEIDNDDLRRTISSAFTTSGVPRYYDTIGDSLFLYPSPDTTQVTATAGGKVYVQREASTFVSTDTTKEPGIAEPFHRVLSLGAAHDYILINGESSVADRIMQEYTSLYNDMIRFYSDKNRDIQTKFRPAHRTADYQ